MIDDSAATAIAVEDAAAAAIRPRGELYVTGEDNLLVQAVNSLSGVVLTVAGRTWDPQRRVILPFTRQLTPPANRTASSITIPLAAGFLLDLTVYASTGAPLSGQTYVMVQLVRGLNGPLVQLATLTADYVTSMQCVCWPGSPPRSSTAGEPYLRIVGGTTPAIGSEVSETVPTGARWELVTFGATYFPSALGANRVVRLFYSDAGGILAVAPQVTAVAPGTLVGCHWMEGLPMTIAFAGDRIVQGLVTAPALLAGMTILTNTVGFLGGDQWFSVRYLVREWLEVP